nr:tetratricopeptide repeat protein [Bacteroides intestinalis]
MDTQKKEIEDLIAKTIRQIGHEKDMQDIETLRSFTANIKRKSRIRSFLIPITSIAAVFAFIFSLNIYHNNRIMDNLFTTYYTPLEYDQELASRGNESISPELISAMNAYHKKLYKDALQEFNVMQSVDRNFLIYKAICLIETKQLPEAIDLLKQLVNDGEGTEYWQQANWYLAISYLGNHQREKAVKLFNVITKSNTIYHEKANKMIQELK